MTKENQTTETIAELQAQVTTMAKHLHRAGLLPAEVKDRRPPTAEERSKLLAEAEAVDATWKATTARVQSQIDAAQERYQNARGVMNVATSELEGLRTELTRATEEMVEKRDAIRRELL